MPIRRKNWDTTRGAGLKFTVEYKFRDDNGVLQPISIAGWTASVSLRASGREFLSVSGTPGIVTSNADGRIVVTLTPSDINQVPGSCEYVVLLTKNSAPSEVSAIARGVIRVAP